jgi:predicted AlkP superfamily pyrophosphatase or phosphodiesterase
MPRLASSLIFLSLALSGCVSTPTAPVPSVASHDKAKAMMPRDAQSPVILVSIDGFRNDYLERGITPALQRLVDGGSRAQFMRPSYPSITFPNHYTLVTGLRPDRHGVIANFMTDPAIPDVRFSMFDRDTVGDERWWNDGKPLWTSVREHGGRAAAMFWVGSEAPVHGAHPEFWRPFDINMTSQQRVQQVLEWLALPPAQRPHFITLYFDLVDTMGHKHGPDSAQLNAALVEVDQAMGHLLLGIDASPLTGKVNLVIGSDHGMTATGADKQYFLDELVDVSTLDFSWTGAYASFNALPGGEPAAQALMGKHPQMQCMTREQIPARFHYGQHRRVPAYICIAEHGWQITTREAFQRKGHSLLGEHGYDNQHPEMHSPFIAYGPAFKAGAVIPGIDNVDVYPLLAHLLKISPAENDGDLARTGDALKVSP